MAVDLRASSYGFRVSLKVTLSLISPCIAIYIFQYIFFSFFAVVFFPVLVFRRFLQFLLTTTRFRQAQAHSQVLLRKLVFYTIFLVFVFLSLLKYSLSLSKYFCCCCCRCCWYLILIFSIYFSSS